MLMRKPSRSRPTQPSPQATPDELRLGINRLTKRLSDVREFEPTSVTNQRNIPHVEALAAAVDDALIRTFGVDTVDYKLYCDAAHFDNGPFNYAYPVAISKVHESLSRSKDRSIALLQQALASLTERLEEYPVASPDKTTPDAPRALERKVFIVHGHDEGAREAVARFLEQLRFEVVILHEKANQGRTVIEKVEAYADVGFAVILLTPDDEGCAKGGESAPRARQNVILELGYFVGYLGRKHVCALKRGNLEIPSDFGGVVYESFDANGGWKQALGRELQEVGFDIDWNIVMR